MHILCDETIEMKQNDAAAAVPTTTVTIPADVTNFLLNGCPESQAQFPLTIVF